MRRLWSRVCCQRLAPAAVILALGACQALPAAVSTALTGFGQDVLAAAAQNFAPQYASSLQNLLLTMAESATGMPFTVAQAGHDVDAQHVDAAAYPEEADGEAGYAHAHYGFADTPPTPAAAVGIGLEVAVLAQQRLPDGQVRLRPVEDGDVLYDGRGDPARGDKIKIYFAASCACWVYVIGIDATGYVAPIFPQGSADRAGPVAAHEPHLLPGGTAWWGLDDYRGIEQIYFIASRERRDDIERLVAQLGGQRPSLPADYRPVREPAVVPAARGLVQVQSAAPTLVATEHGAEQAVGPTLFQTTLAESDLVITRWFRHE